MPAWGHQSLPLPCLPMPPGPSLDFSCPALGSKEERGILAWNRVQEESKETLKSSEVYGLPWGIGTKFCASSWTQVLPFWPRLDHRGKGEVGMSQLAHCSQASCREHGSGAAETRM